MIMLSTFSKTSRLTGQVYRAINIGETVSNRTHLKHATALLRHLQNEKDSLASNNGFLVPSRTLYTSDTSVDEYSKLPYKHPKKGCLVYVGMLSKQVKGLKVFSLSTSLLALAAQPLILASAKDDFMFKAGLLGTFSIVIFSTPALVHFVTRKYVTDVYFNDETRKFTLATKSLFLRRKEFEYIADDVVVPFVETMFTTHKVKGRAFFMNKSDFLSKEAYIHMVGYDKPVDHGIKDPNAQNIPKKKKKFGLWEDEMSAEDKEKEEMKKKQAEERQTILDEVEEEKKRMSRVQ